MPNDRHPIFDDPDFRALDDSGKARVLKRLNIQVGTDLDPQIEAEQLKATTLPGTNVPVGQTARDAAKIALTSTAGEALGPLVNRVRGGIAGLRPGTAPAGVRDPGIPGEPNQGAIDYARNAQLNRAALQRGGAASTGSVSGRVGPATGSVPLRAKVAGAASSEPAAAVTRPSTPSTLWTPESSAQNTGMWHAGQGTMPNPEVQTPGNLRLLDRIKQMYMGQADPAADQFRQSLFDSLSKKNNWGKIDPRGGGGY